MQSKSHDPIPSDDSCSYHPFFPPPAASIIASVQTSQYTSVTPSASSSVTPSPKQHSTIVTQKQPSSCTHNLSTSMSSSTSLFSRPSAPCAPIKSTTESQIEKVEIEQQASVLLPRTNDPVSDDIDLLKLQLNAYDRIQRIQDRVLSNQDIQGALSNEKGVACLLETWRQKAWELIVQRNWADLNHKRYRETAEAKLEQAQIQNAESNQKIHLLNANIDQLRSCYDISVEKNKELERSCSKLNQALLDAEDRNSQTRLQLDCERTQMSHMGLHLVELVEHIDQFSATITERLDLHRQKLEYAIARLEMARVMYEASRKSKDSQTRQMQLLQTEVQNLRTDRRILLERISLAEMPVSAQDVGILTSAHTIPPVQTARLKQLSASLRLEK
ncbi:hypothetical protein BASA50_011050 [Batrachochytrium salamandrivorans]|uniref:Alpha-helical coiled-coil rod protein n=1 Tax=Batrachochytrium salamandrivorans TaxID=1357716 RepID=A0ABQ8EWN0_9FUNG|nr:hypothetical protein BASA50_011050 [Batrachochytrium salamandrivorans]